MATVTLASHAMATRFELMLYGGNASALRAAGGEALAEIRRLEAQLSPFVPSSEIAHLNARAGREPVRVTPTLLGLLRHAQKLTSETGGAFDITIGPLMRCWGFRGGGGRLPTAGEVAEAKGKVGMHLVQLDSKEFTVHFAREGVMLDLGAIGKGYAIERAVELLREGGVTSALLHGGTSTLYGLGKPPGAESWLVALDDPGRTGDPSPASDASPGAGPAPAAYSILTMQERRDRDRQKGELKPLATISLRDESLSLSGIWGRFFQAQGKTLGHIIDPRTGEPAKRAVLSAVVLPSATETDALSTALLTLGHEGHDQIARLRPGMRTLVVSDSGGRLECKARGIRLEARA
jgi:thiamine biosynthesis lipoprotein